MKTINHSLAKQLVFDPSISEENHARLIKDSMTPGEKAYCKKLIAANDATVNPNIITDGEADETLKNPEDTMIDIRDKMSDILKNKKDEMKYLKNPVPKRLLIQQDRARDILNNKYYEGLFVRKMSISRMEEVAIVQALQKRNILGKDYELLPEKDHLNYEPNKNYEDNEFTNSDKKYYVEQLNDYLEKYLNSPIKGVIITDYDNTNLEMTKIKKLLKYLEYNAEREQRVRHVSLEDLCKEMLLNTKDSDTLGKANKSLSLEQVANLTKMQNDIDGIKLRIESTTSQDAKNILENELISLEKGLAFLTLQSEQN